MKFSSLTTVCFCVLAFAFAALAQTQPLAKRTTYKTDRFEFGVGGTVAIVGAPQGSIRVEGWANREIEITAEIEIQAPTEADLDKLSQVIGFTTEETVGRTGIISLGTQDKKALKKAGKTLTKNLLGMPYRIDYVIKVPKFTDVQVDGGKGDFSISGVEGALKLNFIETNARVELVGGATTATFGNGNVEIVIPNPRWRSAYTDIQLASGKMTVALPPSLNADLDALILRSGKIENTYADLKPRVRKVEFTDKAIAAKSGNGGSTLKFTVGDGTLKISQFAKPS
jgi:hypothetical protein